MKPHIYWVGPEKRAKKMEKLCRACKKRPILMSIDRLCGECFGIIFDPNPSHKNRFVRLVKRYIHIFMKNGCQNFDKGVSCNYDNLYE